MRATNPVAASKDTVGSDILDLRGSFSKTIDYATLNRKPAAVSTGLISPLDTDFGSSHTSLSTMDIRSSASDSSHEMPCWPHCEPTNEQGGVKADPRGRCYSPCSTSPTHSPSKHFKFCFSDPKSDCMDGCHRRVKYRRRQHRNPHTRLHRHAQVRHPDCVRFNASGPVPRQGLISFQYISKLFQPWLWRPSKGPTPRTPDVSSSHDDPNDEADSSMFVVAVLVVLILIGIVIYMSQNRDMWDNLSFELNSPSKVLGFENYLKNEVIDEMGEKTACPDCKSVPPKVEKVSPPQESESSGGVGLEKYLRKKANRIINRLN